MAFLLRDPTNQNSLTNGCVASLRLTFGVSNWERWLRVMEETNMSNLQSFISWLLDLAEKEMNYHGYSSNVDVSGTYDSGDVSFSGDGREVADDGAAPVDDDVVIVNAAKGDNQILHDSSFGENERREDYAPASSDAQLYPSGAVAGVSQADDGVPVAITFIIPNNTFYCTNCQVSLSDMEIIKEHMRLRHMDKLLTISCHCCNQKFSSIADYIDYHKVASSLKHPSKNRQICTYCAKSFSAKRDLEDHIANKHLKLGPRHQCPFCEKRFSHANNLRIHKKKCSSQYSIEAGPDGQLQMQENHMQMHHVSADCNELPAATNEQLCNENQSQY